MQEPIYNNGTVKVAKEGVSAYLAWYHTLSMADAKEISDVCSRLTKEAAKNAGVDLYDIGRNTFSFFGHQTEENWEKQRASVSEKMLQFFRFAEDFEQPIRVALWSKEAAFVYIGNPQKGIIVMEPEKYMTYTPDRDYSDLTPAQAMAELGSAAVCDMSIIPVGAGTALSQKTVKEQLSAHQSEIEKLKSEMKDVEGAKTGELAELTAQIEALKQELWQKKNKYMAELSRKMEELEEKKEQLEGQIYLLDSQIYAIRCYAGEVVNFTRIRSGKNAPDTEPIVVHQKLRFLDEDLGRLASLYEIQWNELDMFESFLKHSPYALDTFAPNERCVMLVRLSRTGKSIGRAMDNEGRPYHNMLDRYDYYHGKTVGIIIRNGENLYLGWTDENRVHISDDLILTRAQVVTETVPEEPKEFIFESERKRYVKEQREQRKRILDGLVSRTFVYNILQGVVDHSALLPLPKGVTLAKQSEYVIFSVADKWISDNKYGSFTDIIARCNQKVQQGDVLLTTQHLVPETDSPSIYPRAWQNVRGRGERNRTHDCSVDDCTLYKANLVEYDPPIEMVEFQRRSCQGWMDGPFKAKAKYFDEKEGDIILRHYQTEPERHVFVSAEKSGEWNWNRTSAANARANFELYDGEYINLTYLNSVWLEYVVTNKSLGDWRIGGIAVDYAYAIRYLKTALDYIRKREEGEKALLDAIDPSICQDAEWPVKLSEWKLRAGVRTITKYQAKRFAAALGKEAQTHG